MRIHPLTARSLIGLALVLGFAGPAIAQDTPKADVAISYSILRDQDIEETFSLGWVAAVAGNLNDWFAIVGEVGGNYKSIDILGIDIDLNVHSFLAGPRFAGRQSTKATPFGQILVGAARASGGAFGISASRTAFAIQPGGGVDIAVSPNVGIRLQGDYRAIRDEGETSNEFRFAVGVLFRLGRR